MDSVTKELVPVGDVPAQEVPPPAEDIVETPQEQPDVRTLLRGLFDDPPVAVSAEPATVSGLWDGDDDQFLFGIESKAMTPSEDLDPAEIVGEDGIEEMVAADPFEGGAPALAAAMARWDWAMTPGDRVRALADVEFRRRVRELAGMVPKRKRNVDPVEYSAKVTAERRARNG